MALNSGLTKGSRRLAHAARFDDYLALHIALLIAFPLLLLFVNDSWATNLPAPDWIDPFLQTGYFLHLRDYLNDYPTAYYGSRLPFLLLGSIVHSVLPPLTASLALRLILFYVSAASLFATVRVLYRNNVAASFSVILLGCCDSFLWAIGWDYVDGPGIALTFLATALFTLAARTSHPRIWLSLAAAAQVLMVSETLLLAFYVPFQLVWYAALSYRGNGLAWRRDAPAYAAGAIGMLAALCFVNWLLVRNLWFFVNQLNISTDIASDPSRWKASTYGWVDNASWVFMSVVSLLAAGVYLTILRRRALKLDALVQDPLVVSTVLLGGALAGMIVLEMRGFYFLQDQTHADSLLPFAFVALGMLIGEALGRSRMGRQGLYVAAAGTVLAIAPFAIGMLGRYTGCSPRCGVIDWPGVLALTLVAAIVLFAWRRDVRVLLGVVLLASVMSVALSDQRVFHFPPRPDVSAKARLVYDLDGIIHDYAQGRPVRLWYDAKEPQGDIFHTVGAIRLYGFNLVSEDFPSRTNALRRRQFDYLEPTNSLTLNETIAILSSSDDALARANAALEAEGLRVEAVGAGVANRGALTAFVSFVRVQPLTPDHGFDVRIQDFRLNNGAKPMEAAAGSVAFETLPTQWMYAAEIDLSRMFNPATSYSYIRLRLSVSGSTIGVGLLNASGDDFLSRSGVQPSDEVQEIYLQVKDDAAVGKLIIQTWDTPESALVRIEGLRLIEAAP